jgi:hypothetical protein
VKPDLQALLVELQRELRLQDWRVEISYVPNLTNGAGYPVHGLCSHLVDAKVASIAIRDPETPATASDPSVEETLVHELVHLHFAPFSGSSSAEIAAEEQAVWALTEALHGAKTAARRGQIARAMMARAAAGATTGKVVRSQKMDIAMLLAALKAALQADDPKAAIEALLKEVEGAGAAPSDPVPPGEQEPPPAPLAMDPEDPKPPMQAAALPEDEPKAQRAGGVSRKEFDRLQVETVVHQHGAKLNDKQRAFALTLSPAQVRSYIATQTSGGEAPKSAAVAAERQQAPANGVSRVEFERFRVDQLLTQHGAHLSDAQRKFAAGLSHDQVRSYLANHPAGDAPRAAQRSQVPTKGGAGNGPDDRDARRERLGLSSSASPIVKVGNVLQLGAMTREQAIAHRAKKGAAK